ncbi:MAG: hypothetical protein N3A66_00660, partial [Planctomycetota bacterium]|nr:hypothetical protein [Planctomycetota bacterium]
MADAEGSRKFPCRRCGGELIYPPGGTALECPYCGHRQEIPADDLPAVREEDFAAALAALEGESETHEQEVVKCSGCGAETTLPAAVAAAACPYCGTHLTNARAKRRAIRPKALLPFKIDRRQAQAAFHAWVKSRWFAPGDLKNYAGREESLQGVYLPYWTYDAKTTSAYTGERGDDYYVTEHYTAYVNGKSVPRTRQVRKTRWRPASGTVQVDFDDILVLASNSLRRDLADALEPWDLQSLVPYAEEYLSGYTVEAYQVDLRAGFEQARAIMASGIESAIRRDIGGDHQRIHSVRTAYRDITYKHILLPVWLSAYRYRGKVYRLLVNARTAEVPVSYTHL